MTLSLTEFAAALTSGSFLVERAETEMLELQAEAIEEKAKSLIGTYDAGWKQLAEQTQKDRERKGFAPNEPLLRTGDLRDSISHAIDGDVAYVFSNSPIARYQELGTSKIPPRPFLSTASAMMEETCHEIAARGTVALLESALMKAPLRTLRGLTHIGEILPSGEGVTQVLKPPAK